MTSNNKTLEGCARLFPDVALLPLIFRCGFKVMDQGLAQCLVNDGPLG